MESDTITSPRDRIDDDKVCLTISCPVFTAHCHYGAVGDVWYDGDIIDSISHGSQSTTYGAPYLFDIEFHTRKPYSEECKRLAEFLGPRFKDEFTHKVGQILEMIDGADDPQESQC